MKRALYIGLALLTVANMAAETVTVSEETYQTATLNGDVSETMTASFYSDTKSGGRVGQGKHATMALGGMPAGMVQQVTLWIKSNKTSGAATIRLQIHGRQWTVASGSYAQWPGMGKSFSTELKPLKCLSQPCTVNKGDTVRIEIDGTENSVTVDRMVVDYEPSLPVAHNVILSYCGNQGERRQDTIVEDTPLSGITLPAVPQECTRIWVDNTPWRWVGWTEQQSEYSTEEPLHWEAEDWYGPEDDRTLYALYIEDKQMDIVQDTTSASGEFALVHLWLDSAFAMSGVWQQGKIAMEPVNVALAEDGLYHWYATCAQESMRYYLRRTADSMTVQQGTTWIGYSLSGAANKEKFWAWKRGIQGSIFPHSTWTHYKNEVAHLDYWQGHSWFMNETLDRTKEVSYKQEMWQEEAPYWLLFPTGALPDSYTRKWSTLPYVTALQTIDCRSGVRKEMRNGYIRIRGGNSCYTLLGELL